MEAGRRPGVFAWQPVMLKSKSVCSCGVQCESMAAVEKKLKDMGIQHVRALVEEGGIQVEQLFFHDPDGFMIEICDCDNLPVIPLAGEIAQSCSYLNLERMQQQMQPMVQQHERAI